MLTIFCILFCLGILFVVGMMPRVFQLIFWFAWTGLAVWFTLWLIFR